jgi:hypothetical protein
MTHGTGPSTHTAGVCLTPLRSTHHHGCLAWCLSCGHVARVTVRSPLAQAKGETMTTARMLIVEDERLIAQASGGGWPR